MVRFIGDSARGFNIFKELSGDRLTEAKRPQGHPAGISES
jgi:hypothetical protein